MDSLFGFLFLALALLAVVLVVWVVFVRDHEPRSDPRLRIEPILPRSLAAMRDRRASRGSLFHAPRKDD